MGRALRVWFGSRCLLLLSVLITLLFLQVVFLHSRSAITDVSGSASRRLYTRDVEQLAESNKTTEDIPIPRCQVIHVGLKCLTTSEIYYCGLQIKSVLMFTQSVLKFHVLASHEGHRIVKTLIDSWQLQHVDVQYYFSYQGVLAVDYFLQFPIEGSDTLLVLRPQTYFSFDIERLWKQSKQYDFLLQTIDSTYQTLHNIPHLPYILKPIQHSVDGIVVHFSVLRNPRFCETVTESMWAEVRPDFLFVYQRRCNLTEAEAQKVKQLTDIKKLPRLEIPGMLDPIQKKLKTYQFAIKNFVRTLQPMRITDVDSHYWPEWYCQILDTSGDWVRTRQVEQNCRHLYSKPHKKPKETLGAEENQCSHYLLESSSPRRIHLYFNNISSSAPKYHRPIGSHNTFSLPRSQPIKSVGTTVTHDITLVTQLQYNRLQSLQTLIDSWEGPMQVVLYLSDMESHKLRKRLEKAELQRSNIFYHVVYKRHSYNPINVLRNVGLKETTTDYVFVVDVDFVPNPGLYRKLLDVLNYLHTYNKTRRAVIIPTFETTQYNYKVPDNKTEFIRHLHEGIVEPYHQGKAWSFKAGHKPHRYQKWFNAKNPYQVLWEEKFEPYFVMPTIDSPMFEEILLERMMDKFPYSLEVHLKGYKFFVLHDVFMVHLPHPKSVSYGWMKETNFHWCVDLFYTTIKENLYNIYDSQLKKRN